MNSSHIGWSGCPAKEEGQHSAYNIYSYRRAQPLGEDPEVIAARVRDAIQSLGYDVRIQHDRNLDPPRVVIGFPRGYFQGSEPDGFGFDFMVGEGDVSFSLYGRCVVGDILDIYTPDLG